MAQDPAGARKLETCQCAFRFALVVLLLGTLIISALPFTASREGASSESPASSLSSLAASRMEKSHLTDSQQKLSTDLLGVADAGRRGESVTGDLVYVYIYLNPPAETQIIDPYAWNVTDRAEEHHLAVAWVDTARLEALASLEAVRSIRTVMPPRVMSGSVTTEGDTIHRTAEVRANYSFNGSGVKVGIISDGVDHLTDAQSSGDLPANVTVLNNRIGGDEGTAMLEIVHDLAPGAQLYFHDCGANKVAFMSAIDALVAAGCDVICDDVEWIDEPFFEDGPVASHLNTVLSSNDLIYVSAAGNAGQSHYQGDFYNDGDNYHDFSHGLGSRLYVTLPQDARVTVVLQWNDPFGASGNDYDLYLLNTYDGRVVAKSIARQNGNDDPLEVITYTYTESSGIEVEINVHKFDEEAASRTLEVFIYPENGASIKPDNLNPADSIFGHHAVSDAVTVVAINASDPGADPLEPASSRGPVTISYPSSVSRSKPDLSGVDGVNVTGAGGIAVPFYGTSAAAAHVAGIAALIWSAFPGNTSEEIRNRLSFAAVDLGSAGYDHLYGCGRADALRVFGVPPQVVTEAATNVSTATARLKGNLTDTGGETCTVWFEYGLNDSYGMNTTAEQKETAGTFAANLSGLTDNTAFHYRAVANNSKGTACGTDMTFTTVKELPSVIFDTGPGTYPSISGRHNGTITPNQTITLSRMYIYPSSGTGGHIEYASFSFPNSSLMVEARWDGYKGDWHYLSFDRSITLGANETYFYTILTGSYPQIHHRGALPTAVGWINCTEFTDAEGKIHHDWIPAIRLE